MSKALFLELALSRHETGYVNRSQYYIMPSSGELKLLLNPFRQEPQTPFEYQRNLYYLLGMDKEFSRLPSSVLVSNKNSVNLILGVTASGRFSLQCSPLAETMFVDVPPYDMVRVIQREVPRTQLESCFTPLRSFASLAANIRVADRASRTYGIYDPECEDPLFNI